jgi:hypothetical protein
MKKLMTALTICAVAGFAVAADVVSENIVGFCTASMPGSEWRILGLNWNKVGGADPTLDNLLAQGTAFSLDDQFQYVEPGGATKIYTYVIDGLDQGWWDVDADNWGVPTLPTGSGGWFFTSASANIKLVGEVPGTVGMRTFAAGAWYIISSSYPVSLEVNNGSKVAWTGLAVDDQIQVIKEDGSPAIYTYVVDGLDQGWWDVSADDWAVGGIAEPGKGMYLYVQNEVTMTETL